MRSSLLGLTPLSACGSRMDGASSIEKAMTPAICQRVYEGVGHVRIRELVVVLGVVEIDNEDIELVRNVLVGAFVIEAAGRTSLDVAAIIHGWHVFLRNFHNLGIELNDSGLFDSLVLQDLTKDSAIPSTDDADSFWGGMREHGRVR